jgi:DNA-binding NarL/FixJ family response regulator
VYTAHATLEYFHRAMALDVKGFVKKEYDIKPKLTLVEIIRMVAGGGEFYDQELFKQYKKMIGESFVIQENVANMARGDELTEREKEILRLISRNLNNQEIADQLIISINTVKVHVSNIFEKLKVHTKREALIIAKTRNLI